MSEIKQILKSYKVLYAEDDLNVQKSVSEYLNKYFGEVITANNGKEALSLYSSDAPDILFLDIDMPIMDGLQVAQEVRKNKNSILIVILTAYTDTDKLLRATELNLSKYLLKPIDPTEFKSMLHKVSQQLQDLSSNFIDLKDDYKWNTQTEELTYNTTLIALTQKEQSLLSLLISKRNQCVRFIDIETYVWEDSYETEVSIQSIKLQVTLLRKKLPKDSIKNVYGKGYILWG